MKQPFQNVVIVGMAVALSILMAVNASGEGENECAGDFDFPPGTPLVKVGFWMNEDCSGKPVCEIPFPVEYGDEKCFAWPGNSGENSATNFQCGDNSLSYTQWTTLTCSGGELPEGRNKTSYTDRCEQDYPPTLYSRIVDFSGCATD